jgi:formylglycine-generating enzyme required for sulfatase activity
MPDVGVCEVGETRFRPDAAACGPYLVNRETCSSTCEWAVTTACTDECGGTARTSPAWAIERCIPAGTFIRGRNDASADQGPEAEIYISAFYLDVFTVTNDRYRACVADGGCGALTTSFTTASAVSSYNNPARGAYPLEHISRTAASRFCEWDGRRLATDAELAKAARGPAPRRNLYPWGTIYDCADFGWCTWSMGTFVHDVAYDGLPETRSYYGIERLLAGGYEYTSDPYRENYYTTDASRVPDPPGPTGAASQVRGSRPRLPTSVTVRNQLGTQDVGFRCGRSVSGGM